MTDRFKNAANDLLSAVKVATWESRDRLVISWVYVPVGVLAILSACFGVDKLLTIGSISFPASVACLIILFLGLLLLEQCIGEHRARRIVSIIDIPGGWSLRWINIFFTPSFVLLPLSPPIGGIEVLKIIAVFVIGFFVMMISATYITRGLQVLFGTSKRAMVERAEELRTENEAIPMTVTSSLSRHATTASESEEVLEIQQPERSQAPPGTHQTTSESSLVSQAHRAVLVAQAPIPPSRVARWSILVSGKLDMIAYAALFIFVGLPVYYAADYAMPLQLTFNILTYFAAMSLPATWRQYLHPVLVSSLFTVLGIWVLGLIKDQSLGMTLLEYRPGANYLKLWNGQHRLPGAGDIFGSVLDASDCLSRFAIVPIPTRVETTLFRHHHPQRSALHRFSFCLSLHLLRYRHHCNTQSRVRGS
ncbi:hypothetical protein GGR57DRAFT_233858 [Xylariaceae sp. FL1272]|nr:hypothetical protein GGR57DRAFT_233858 [Xylariaceae sp. FL1272]